MDHGWTFAEIGELTPDQLAVLACEGKKPKGIPIQSEEDALKINRKHRQRELRAVNRMLGR